MTLLSLEEPQVEIAGAAVCEVRDDGLRPRRLPESCWHQLDVGTQMAMRTPSGVRIAFRTDSPSVTLTLMTTVLHMPARRDGPPVPSVDLLVDGALHESARCEGGRQLVLEDLSKPENVKRIPGRPTRLEFSGLPGGEHHVELWLPCNAQVALDTLEVADGASVAAPSDQRARWLHYGSSISQCAEATSPARTWPALASRLADLHLISLGLGGSCHLDPYVARHVRDLELDLISLKLGINVLNGATMRERTFVPAVHGFLDTLRDGQATLPILVVSPIFCPSAEDRPGPTEMRPDRTFHAVGSLASVANGALTLRRMREILADVVAVRRKRGDPNLHYLDGLELFGPEDAADLPDDLHPNGPGYERMGQRFHELALANGGALSRCR